MKVAGLDQCKDSAEKPYEYFEWAQHERKFFNDFSAPPFVLRLSKDERRVFQQNLQTIESAIVRLQTLRILEASRSCFDYESDSLKRL
jgi:hypothetical protein